jgi:hypothetical protein
VNTSSLKGHSIVKLAKIFAMGNRPSARHLLGKDDATSDSEWRVDMLTGKFPNLGGGFFNHRKHFQLDGDKVVGFNVFFGNTRWGYFALDDRTAFDNIDGRSVLAIDYNQAENGWLLRGAILDKVRTTGDPNLLIGEFFLITRKGYRFASYFSLARIS